MPVLIAIWNPARDVWETAAMSLFSEHQDVFSETWPTSGMTRRGALLPLPTSVPAIDATDCSSSQLLPTPTTEPHTGNGHARNLGKEVQLLPTPVAHDSGNSPEEHLRKKPGREVVTSLAIICEHDLFETGGRLPG